MGITGQDLSCEEVERIARRGEPAALSPDGLERARAAWLTARDVSSRQAVYGRTTGVGANRLVEVEWDDGDAHGLRLLRSHAAGAGPPLAPEIVRAMLVVRLNQLAAGGSGVDPGVLPALIQVLNRGLIPPVPSHGAIGTGDLTALASTALCLLGERLWLETAPAQDTWYGDPATASPGSPISLEDIGRDSTHMPHFRLRSPDALAFISSNAATLGESALACHDLCELLDASIVVAGLSLIATDSSAEPYAPAVHDACPHPGQRAVAAAVRKLIADEKLDPARIQDPYGYRAFPQVHGPAMDALAEVTGIVERELNAAAENPLIDVAGNTVWHNGNFHTAYVGLGLDAVRAALFQTAALSASRLGTLVEPTFSGLNPFLAETDSSSGIMILEYVAHSAIADIRRLAAPAALGNAVLSRGVEEHAGFSTQSARATTEALPAYRVAIACELVACVRALRMRERAPSSPLLEAYETACAVLDPRVEDRPLDTDISAAADLLPSLAALLR